MSRGAAVVGTTATGGTRRATTRQRVARPVSTESRGAGQPAERQEATPEEEGGRREPHEDLRRRRSWHQTKPTARGPHMLWRRLLAGTVTCPTYGRMLSCR